MAHDEIGNDEIGNDEIGNVVRSFLTAHFGHAPTSASMSFVGVEPIEILRFLVEDVVNYVTLGMSARPLPSPTTSAGPSVTPAIGPRGELLLSVRVGDSASVEVWRRLALLGVAPEVEGLRYADGAIVSLGESLAAGVRATGVVVADSGISIPTGRGPVTVFRLDPAMPEELAWARVHGMAALRARWHEQGTDLIDLARRSVDLS